MAGLKVELLNAVGALGPDRSFNFVFFESDKIRLLDRKGTVAATDENRRRAERFLGGLTTTIASDPVKGLRAAFRQSPDVVYLLADGNFPDNDAVTGAIGRLNRGRRARVHTVLLVDGWDTDPALVATLREIAKQNGGTFRRVPVARLGG
jgi:hypothetical protein